MHTDVLHEVRTDDGLCFQLCRWHWDGATPTEGFRFIWRDEQTSNLKPTRGQAYIPDAATLMELLAGAMKEGWLR